MSYTNFTVSGLTAYIAQSKDLLIKKLALGRGTRERISIQTGVKFKEHLHILDVAPALASGLDCGFTGAGTATLTERLIECPALKVNMEICPENLIGKYAEYLVRLNANENSLPFEEYLMDGIIDGINRQIETMIWLGDKTNQSSDPVKKWIDGFITIAAASVSASTGVVGESIASGKTAYEGLLQVYASMTENTLERGGVIFVSPAIYRAFMQDMVALNFYHYNPGNEEAKEFPLPGTDVKIIRTEGLAGSLKVLGTYAANLYYGCDMENDNEDIKVWFSDDDQVYKLLAKWNSGVQIAFLDQVVLGTFAATPASTTGVAAGVKTLSALAGAYDATNGYIETHANV
jgi:hypothetical protein